MKFASHGLSKHHLCELNTEVRMDWKNVVDAVLNPYTAERREVLSNAPEVLKAEVL